MLVETDAGHDAVLALARLVRDELAEAALEVVPGHRTVLVVGRDGPPDRARLAELAERAEDAPPAPEDDAPPVEIAVRYDGADLIGVAELCGVSPEELVRRHIAPLYRVAFVGFSPGFAYLVGGDPLLEVPRLEQPRTSIPAGSVAIAGPYSTVYPSATPGGWRLLGTTEARLFDPSAAQPALLEPGARVRFAEAP